jgi:hypothetical protein
VHIRQAAIPRTAGWTGKQRLRTGARINRILRGGYRLVLIAQRDRRSSLQTIRTPITDERRPRETVKLKRADHPI